MYSLPMETAGNVAISDAFGMDFRCTHSIIVTRLGIFDGVNFQKNTQRKRKYILRC